MLLSKKKYRPPFALSFKSRRLIRLIKKSAMVKKKIKSISLAGFSEIGAAAPVPPEDVAHLSTDAEEPPTQDSLSDENYCPPEDDEKDNPFILVNHRKSSRKAAKRH
uniref:Uncharacterized protein n=1 Tax=Brassica campestris TaxID=3711 RepID=M4EY33_BRACM